MRRVRAGRVGLKFKWVGIGQVLSNVKRVEVGQSPLIRPTMIRFLKVYKIVFKFYFISPQVDPLMYIIISDKNIFKMAKLICNQFYNYSIDPTLYTKVC